MYDLYRKLPRIEPRGIAVSNLTCNIFLSVVPTNYVEHTTDNVPSLNQAFETSVVLIAV